MSTKASVISHVTPVGGNVFSDFGFDQPTANKLKSKAQLMVLLSDWIKAQQFRQEDAAKLFNVNRPRVSDVICGKIDKFTIDALVDMVEKTGQKVVLSIE